MTAQDNRQETIQITVSTQTDAGAHWEGTAILTGPYDPEMVAKAVEISDDLVAMAMAESRRERLKQTVWEGVPEKPRRRRRSKAEIDTDNEKDLMLGKADPASNEPESEPEPEPSQTEVIPGVFVLAEPDTDDDLPF